MGSTVLQSTRTDEWSDWVKETDSSLDAAEGTDGLSDGAKEIDKLSNATEEIGTVGRLEGEDCVEGQHLLNRRGRRNDIVHESRKTMRTDVAQGILN